MFLVVGNYIFVLKLFKRHTIMKNFNSFVMAVALGGLSILSSCNDNDLGNSGNNGSGKPFEVPQSVLNAFNSEFPGAENVSWTSKEGYAVASFYYSEASGNKSFRSADSNANTNAWFLLSSSSLEMTDTDIPFSLIPQAVLDGFNSTVYSNAPWKHDDEVDLLKRKGKETLYIIEVEKKENNIETEIDLYFTEDGILVKEVVDAEKDNDHFELLPETPAASIVEWINNNYEGARIIDIENEDNGTEVEFIYNGKHYEAVFNMSGAWLYTKVELSKRDIPSIETVVMDSLRMHPAYTTDDAIDDIERYESSKAGKFYKFELETRLDDVDVYLNLNGELLDGRPSLGDDESFNSVGEEIAKFISTRYPGAVITEKDYDNGYLEIEIMHEGIEKKVLFNGKNEWVKTVWEISVKQLPEQVKVALENRGYQLNRIDEVEVVETNDSIVYMIEVETSSDDVVVVIDSNGNILNEYKD